MTYELAKKLKDARFPHKYIIAELNGEQTDAKYFPTLSDLIEACGDRFSALNRYTTRDIWECYGIGKEQIRVEGSTPEEAVANLWLKLNENA